jgi:transposase InsO family protein
MSYEDTLAAADEASYFTRKITTVGVGWVAQLSQRCRKTLLNSPLLAGLSLHSPSTHYGPEFTRHVLGQWADEHQVRLQFIELGKPIQNAFIESFNNRLREEYLNAHAFVSLDRAHRTIEQWRAGYNSERPHKSRLSVARGVRVRQSSNKGYWADSRNFTR